MAFDFLQFLANETHQLKEAGLYKDERTLLSPQQANIRITPDAEVINFCANNYLGLSNHSHLLAAAKQALDKYGYGMSSVRFICGTQEIHLALETKLSEFLSTESTLLYSSCFDANGGLFETLLNPEDAIISDALNHASIIDGIRLCKAKRLRYANNDMQQLEQQLQQSQDCRVRLIATDGVFSMDGVIANLKDICDLAQKYHALVMVDDSHASGFIGATGRGTPQLRQVQQRVDIITSTLGKALGGASGGFTSGRRQIIDWLRQRSRPYLFSNSLAPVIAATTIKALELLEQSTALRDKLADNSRYFRQGLQHLGFNLIAGEHPIIPVMLGDARLAQEMASLLLKEGIYVIGFSYPVVPKGQARIRTQMSAAHTRQNLDQALDAFNKVGKHLQLLR